MNKQVTNWCESPLNIYTKKKMFLVNVFLCACVLVFPNLSIAKGIAAGTTISNIAIVSYTVDSVIQESIKSSPSGNSTSGNNNGKATQFIVDRKVDLLVTGNSNANVNPGDAQAEVTFTLENQGNATQEFSLSTDSLFTTDNFDPNSCSSTVTGVTGSPVAGVTLPTTGNIKLAADQQASIIVKCDIPLSNNNLPILSGDIALVGLKATVEKNEDNTNTVQSTNTALADNIETIFADGAGSDDISRDASHSDRLSYIASTGTLPPTLSIDKSIFSVVDPAGGNSSITGSEITYKIKINSAGIGTIENLVITDPTPTELTYKLNSIQVNSINQTDISDAIDNTDYGIVTADTATINLGNFTAGQQFDILITYIIN